MRTRRQTWAQVLAEAAGPPDPVPLIFTLPEELVGHVASFLPTESLKALALTHPRLLPHARARLVAHVSVRGYERAQSAISWCERARPALRRRLRHLTIIDVTERYSSAQQVTQAQFARLLALVPHLEALTISTYVFNALDDLRPTLARAIRGLVDLKELDIVVRDGHLVSTVLEALPDGLGLRMLHIRALPCQWWPLAQPQDVNITVGELRGPIGPFLDASPRLRWLQSARALAGAQPHNLGLDPVAVPSLEALLLQGGLSARWGRMELPRLTLIACTAPSPLTAWVSPSAWFGVQPLRSVRIVVNPTLLCCSHPFDEQSSTETPFAPDQLPNLETVYIPEAEEHRLAICRGDMTVLDQWLEAFRSAHPRGSIRTYSWPFGSDLRNLDLLALLDRGEFVETLCHSSGQY